MEKRKKKICPQCEVLKNLAKDLHWMARRYVDGRQSYAVSSFNRHTRTLLHLGVKLNPTADNIIWARDRQGRTFDGLSLEETKPGTKAAMGTYEDPSRPL